jgi:hypothetical protein
MADENCHDLKHCLYELFVDREAAIGEASLNTELLNKPWLLHLYLFQHGVTWSVVPHPGVSCYRYAYKTESLVLGTGEYNEFTADVLLRWLDRVTQ